MFNTQEKYHVVTRILHWVMAVLIIGAWCAGQARGWFPKGSSARNLITVVHIQVGLSILMLVLPRLLWRITQPAPPIVPKPSKAVTAFSHLAHLLLYVLMIATPIVGILIVQTGGKPVAWFGLPIPVMMGADADAHHTFEERHELLANLLLGLAFLHAAAAIWHHKFVRDNTLLRMK